MLPSGEKRKEGAARGVLWVLLAAVGSRLASLAALVFLARLLAPSDFGLLAFALVYITYAETVADLGAGMALIYWPSRREDAAQVAFALNVGTGLLCFAITEAIAPAVAAFFGNPEGTAILRVLALTFPIKALGNTHDALCQKDLRFRARIVPELGLAVAKGLVSVTLAVAGVGVWSLVWGQLAGTVLWTALLWRAVSWRPRRSWPSGLLGPMLEYGRGIVAVNVLAAVVHHVDLVIVGRMLGATALGLYHIAGKVPEMTITMAMWAVSRVLFPALARAHSEGRATSGPYLAALQYSSLITMPAAVVLVALAEPIVLVLFGPRWIDAAPILRALAVYAGLRSLGTQAGDVLKAAGRPGLLAALGLLRALVLVPALVFAAGSGLMAMASVMAAVTGATLVLSIAVAGRAAKVRLSQVASALRGSMLAATIVGGALWAWSALGRPARDPLGLAISLAVGGCAYLFALRLASPDAFARLRCALTPARAKRPPALGVSGRFLVPLSGAPLRYFLSSLFVPYKARERLARRLPPVLGARLILSRVAQTGSDSRDLAAAVSDGELWRGTPLEGREGLCAIVAHDAPDGPRDRLVAFVFGAEERRPLAVLKRRALDGTGVSLRHEWEGLRRAAAASPPSLAATVPAPLAFEEHDGSEVLLLGWLPGRSAYGELHAAAWPARHARRHFEQAAHWLVRFQAATRLAGRSIETPAGDVPICAAHGDFWARNLLFDGGRLAGVVDWEHFRREAPAYEDLFHFALTYGSSFPWSHRRQSPEEAFRLTFLAENAVSRGVTRYLQIYCAGSGLPLSALPTLFDLYLSVEWQRCPARERTLGPRFQAMLAGSERSVCARLADARTAASVASRLLRERA